MVDLENNLYVFFPLCETQNMNIYRKALSMALGGAMLPLGIATAQESPISHDHSVVLEKLETVPAQLVIRD